MDARSLLLGQGSTAIDPKGNRHSVWTEFVDGDFEVFWALRDGKGKALVPALRITSSDGVSAFPKVLIDSRGCAHILWLDDRDHGTGSLAFELYHRVLNTEGEFLTRERRLSSPRVSLSPKGTPPKNWFSSEVRLAGFDAEIDVQDRLNICWAGFNQAHSEIFYARFDRRGTTTIEPRIVSEGKFEGICLDPRIQLAGDRITILYASTSGSGWRLYYSQLAWMETLSSGRNR
jgi:hypothetical protein